MESSEQRGWKGLHQARFRRWEASQRWTWVSINGGLSRNISGGGEGDDAEDILVVAVAAR